MNVGQLSYNYTFQDRLEYMMCSRVQKVLMVKMGRVEFLDSRYKTVCDRITYVLGPFYTSNFRCVERAIQPIDIETAYLIIYCLNCIRRDGNLTYKTGLTVV